MEYNDEATLIMIVSLPMVAQVPYFSGHKQNFVNDILFQLAPVYLAIMYPGTIREIYIWLFAMVDLGKLRFCRNRRGSRATVVDQERNIIAICVTLAIYAVDFSIFHPSLGKTDFFGLSLMDMGVGSFMYNAGLTSSVKTKEKYIRASAFLALLGSIRYLTVKLCGIKANPREYGAHSNFYFILALVNLLYNLLKSENNFAVGILLTLFYELVLQTTSLPVMLLSDDRRNCIEANKESLSAVICYTSIFLITSKLSESVFSKKSFREKALDFLHFTVFTAGLYFALRSVSPPSRRLGNAAFVFWILMSHTVPLTFHLFMESIIKCYEMPIPTFLSSNMMFVFLFSNLLVLVGNLLFDPKRLSAASSHAVLLSYLALVFVMPAYICKVLNCRKIRIGF
jgi:glucosaminylphosphatidylinositol acyltransferase